MSPAIAARFPWYIKIFHGRQGARSLHFLALCSFIVFFIGHVTMRPSIFSEALLAIAGERRHNRKPFQARSPAVTREALSRSLAFLISSNPV
jgi:hypothetical protein